MASMGLKNSWTLFRNSCWGVSLAPGHWTTHRDHGHKQTRGLEESAGPCIMLHQTPTVLPDTILTSLVQFWLTNSHYCNTWILLFWNRGYCDFTSLQEVRTGQTLQPASDPCFSPIIQWSDAGLLKRGPTWEMSHCIRYLGSHNNRLLLDWMVKRSILFI